MNSSAPNTRSSIWSAAAGPSLTSCESIELTMSSSDARGQRFAIRTAAFMSTMNERQTEPAGHARSVGRTKAATTNAMASPARQTRTRPRPPAMSRHQFPDDEERGIEKENRRPETDRDIRQASLLAAGRSFAFIDAPADNCGAQQ